MSVVTAKKLPKNPGTSSSPGTGHKGQGKASSKMSNILPAKHGPPQKGSSMVKKIGGAQLEAMERYHDEVIREERRRKCIAVNFLVLCLAAMAGVIFGALWDEDTGLMSYFRSDKEEFARTSTSAPDQTDNSATTLQTAPQITNLTQLCIDQHGPCYYHQNHYPDTCVSTLCSSVHMSLKFFPSLSYMYESKKANVSVPDFTACAKGSWCQKGACVESNDIRLNADPPKSHGGGRRLNCGPDHCVSTTQFVKDPNDMTRCSKKLCEKAIGAFGAMSLHFLSCNNPLPVNSTPTCFLQNAALTGRWVIPKYWEDGPFVFYEACKDCKRDKNLFCIYGQDPKYTAVRQEHDCVSAYVETARAYLYRPITKCS